MVALAAICAISGTYSSGRHFIMYRFTGKRVRLIWAVILGITGVTSFVLFILNVLGR